MKNLFSTYLKLPSLVLALVVIGFASCKEDDENLAPMRMFQPGGIISSSSGESSVRLSWKTPPNTVESNVSYTVEVAKDTLFETPVVFSGVTDTTYIVLTEDDIAVKETYFARIKTNATETSGGESKWLTSNSFRIRGIQLFLDNPVKGTDIADNAVILRFTSREELTRIVLTSESGATREITLTPTQKAQGMVTVTGLESRTTYTADILAGNRNRGSTTFRTKEPLSGILIDLREIEGRPGVLEDTITQVPNGSTIILKRGFTYTISSTTLLDRSVTITSGSDLTVPELASIYFTSNFNIVAGSNIEKIVFKDVIMSSDDATSRYIFNINNASAIDTVSFDNVRASKFRGIVRLQSQPTTINNFRVNNSVIDSIGSYGVINIDVASSKVEKISIRNSTIYKAEKFVVSRNNSTSVLLENLTINELPIAGQYLVDYNTSNNVSDGIVLRNVILGTGKADNQTIRGIRAGATTTVSVNNSYNTSDYVTTNFSISGLTPYNGTALNLWVNPKNGDFRFKDQNFPGRNTAGDPRWR
ncbi:DUF5123 domain-containing protein [Rufibacter roseus]|uniref:DUF5123 domain-containing protein n=1 Tax=Rufibacter roseus TaxID=1567108 RepID=A0ABW2DQF3_9BACT|nr:DUF5123 domain-containing protein [Rufibacter roseus]